MCMDMGGGAVAYRHSGSFIVGVDDLVNIFDSATDLELVTVGEQDKLLQGKGGRVQQRTASEVPWWKFW